MEDREEKSSKEEVEEEISPIEDLMREHGVLNRLLLIYEDASKKLSADQEFPLNALEDAVKIIQRFIENYHEKLEEDFLFPKFEKAGLLVELVATLRIQHEAGRRLTNKMLQLLTNPNASKNKSRLVDGLRQFINMYRPHEAREDTELFPALRKVISSSEFDALGEAFEEKEHQLFEGGFESIVEEVTRLEKSLDLFDLSKFTPQI